MAKPARGRARKRLTLKQFARHFDKEIRWAQRWARAGAFPVIRIGGTRYVTPETVDLIERFGFFPERNAPAPSRASEPMIAQ